jgi:UDP-2,4-diacetamido-2,4,6-trideoxy-beta-L-altropyranose hydrolase
VKLYIRADGDSKKGTGHIMRCIALAQAWQDKGGKVTFISHCESEGLRERISEEGFQLIAVEKPHPHPDDLTQTLAYLNSPSPLTLHSSTKWLVMDGYHFTPDYQKAIRDAGIRLLVIDDMNHLPYYHADILLNQNNNAQKLTYNCEEGTILLQGTDYVFLRREFQKHRNFKRVIPKCARKILVSLGGADPDNVTLKVIQALCLLSELQIKITIVVGPANVHKEYLSSALESTGLNYNLLINPPNMVDLMANTDLAISAGGGTYWELAYMGVPCIMIVLAENQKEVAEELAKAGTVFNLGWHNLLSCEDIAPAISSMIISDQARRDMFQKGQAIINGDGANLTVNAMKSYEGRGSEVRIR